MRSASSASTSSATPSTTVTISLFALRACSTTGAARLSAARMCVGPTATRVTILACAPQPVDAALSDSLEMPVSTCEGVGVEVRVARGDETAALAAASARAASTLLASA